MRKLLTSPTATDARGPKSTKTLRAIAHTAQTSEHHNGFLSYFSELWHAKAGYKTLIRDQGANRGLGLALAERLSQVAGNVVIAGARNPSDAKELQALIERSNGSVEAVALDTTKQESVDVSHSQGALLLTKPGGHRRD